MDLTQAHYDRIAPPLPVQRGHVRLSHRQVLNAILSVAAQGGKGRGLPARFGTWHPLSTRLHRWSQTGGLARVFAHLHREQIGRLTRAARSLDRPLVKVPPAGTGARKQPALNPSAAPGAAGPPRCIWLLRTIARLSPSRARPGPPPPPPAGRPWRTRLGPPPAPPAVLRDRASAGAQPRHLAVALG